MATKNEQKQLEAYFFWAENIPILTHTPTTNVTMAMDVSTDGPSHVPEYVECSTSAKQSNGLGKLRQKLKPTRRGRGAGNIRVNIQVFRYLEQTQMD